MVKYRSQSMYKDFQAYQAGDLCGNILSKKYFEGELLDNATYWMKLGTYWEWITFKNLPKNGIEPKAMFNKDGTMKADYERCRENKVRTLEWFFAMGFEVVEHGTLKRKKGHEGTIDLIVRATRKIIFSDGFTLKKGDLFVIDAKYSDLLNDPYSKHGWMWTDIQKEYHGLQAKEYTYLTDLPFFFFVKGRKRLEEVKFFRVSIKPETIEEHLVYADEVYSEMQLIEKLGAEPRPSVENCIDCVLKKNCNDAHHYPHPKLIEL